jgi:hypothetical protein
MGFCRVTERQDIDNDETKRWLGVYAGVNKTMADAGYPEFRGAPVGHLLDIPKISDAASRFASRIRDREGQKQKRSVDVQYTIHLTGGKIVAEASYAVPA